MENMQNYGIGCESVTYTNFFSVNVRRIGCDQNRKKEDGKKTSEYRQFCLSKLSGFDFDTKFPSYNCDEMDHLSSEP